jgi:hypothetical protein
LIQEVNKRINKTDFKEKINGFEKELNLFIFSSLNVPIVRNNYIKGCSSFPQLN